MANENVSEATKKLLKAKAELILDYPFFGMLALRLKYKETPGMGSAGVDGKTLFYDPGFIDMLDVPSTVGLLAHEILHVALAHHVRRYDRESRKWNIACDFAIDPIVKKAGMTLPDVTYMGRKYSPHIDQKYMNMSADHIYALLPDPPEMPSMGSDGNDNGMGAVFDAPSLSNGDNNSPDDKNQGRAMSREEYDALARVEETDWKIAAQQAAIVAKARGKLPGILEELIDEINKPKINWVAVLRTFMTEIRRDDYIWSRPNRRHICNGLFLPMLYSEGMGEIIVVVDTSGSITREELEQFAGELNSILIDVKPEKVHVIYCDSAIQGEVKTFMFEDFPVPLEKKGGGGTDFTEPFHWVEKNCGNPTALVYLTDLYGPCHATPPSYPTLWVCTSTADNNPFGQLLHLEIDNV